MLHFYLSGPLKCMIFKTGAIYRKKLKHFQFQRMHSACNDQGMQWAAQFHS